MKEKLINLIEEAWDNLGLARATFTVEHPGNLAFGDYSTNAGIVSKKGSELLSYIESHKPEEIERVELQSGFINFYLSKEFFKNSLNEILKVGQDFGKNEKLKGEMIMVEHTDPNPFKIFHIGHLMPNVIGSAVANLLRWSGAEVKEACYQGDVGLHVAKAIWAIQKGEKDNPYVVGHKAYEEDAGAKQEIQEINKKIYDRSDKNINKIYDEGRKASLQYFEVIYKNLGTHFDFNFFESETAEIGKKAVLEHPGIFVESDGAIVYNGAPESGLHTRVFINSQGLPTYEAKELGLAKLKFEKYKYSRSIVITGNEIDAYFKVLLAAMKEVYPELAEKTEHLSHGMLRLPSGKMSSRTGDVVSAEELLEEVKKRVKDDESVALGAIKYMILRQAVGGDIIFDFERSVSTEGDSGVYLQYAHARACSLLEKAHLTPSARPAVAPILTEGDGKGGEVRIVEKLLYRFPEIVERSSHEYSPHLLTTYLTELAGAFNNFYAHEPVIDSPEASYLLAIVESFKIVLANGLKILGIPAPERM